MNTKEQQLKKHKYIATSLFIIMAIVYIFMLFLSKSNNQIWIGYIKAFTEAGMVGALADWFAVTALFKYPLGIKIPHANLINKNKNALGENLGLFVSENFLNQATIRPYITKIDLTEFIVAWLYNENNLIKVNKEIKSILKSIVLKIDDDVIINFALKKGYEIITEIDLTVIASKGLFGVLESNEHQRLISAMLPHIKKYVENNKDVIYDKVVEKNPILGIIGGNTITNQLISGILSFLEDIEKNSNHIIRNEITSKLYEVSESFKTNANWKVRFENLKKDFLTEEKLGIYINQFWINTKENLLLNLDKENSNLSNYIRKYLLEIRNSLEQNETTINKINKIVHKFIYKLALKNSSEMSKIITKTVKKWDGAEMSKKLELEIGKDLQYIRINGTLVGGIVGLIIYTISQYIL